MLYGTDRITRLSCRHACNLELDLLLPTFKYPVADPAEHARLWFIRSVCVREPQNFLPLLASHRVYTAAASPAVTSASIATSTSSPWASPGEAVVGYFVPVEAGSLNREGFCTAALIGVKMAREWLGHAFRSPCYPSPSVSVKCSSSRCCMTTRIFAVQELEGYCKSYL